MPTNRSVELLVHIWSRAQTRHGLVPAGEGKAAVSRRVFEPTLALEILPLKTQELLYYQIGPMNLHQPLF